MRFRRDAAETRAVLAAAWAGLPDRLRGPTQFLGRWYAGCAATIGVMPRCDFTCGGCYLGKGANQLAPRPLDEIKPVASAQDVAGLIDQVREVHVGEAVHRYAVDLVAASRKNPDLRLGASPRATLQLVRAAKASAALDGRDYVIPDDIRALAVPVLAHRVLLTAEAQIAKRTSRAVIETIVSMRLMASRGEFACTVVSEPSWPVFIA